MVVGALGLGMAAALQGASSGLILFVFALVLTAISKIHLILDPVLGPVHQFLMLRDLEL